MIVAFKDHDRNDEFVFVTSDPQIIEASRSGGLADVEAKAGPFDGDRGLEAMQYRGAGEGQTIRMANERGLPRYLVTFEADVPSRSAGTVWTDTGELNGCLRFFTSAPEIADLSRSGGPIEITIRPIAAA